MSHMGDFVGTWRASQGAPFSDHTFTWSRREDGLEGRWIIEAPDSPGAREAARQGQPTRAEIQVVGPWLESGVFYFTMPGGPGVCEFRLTAQHEAVFGAAVDKLPAELATPELRRAIDGHRVRVTRRAEPTE